MISRSIFQRSGKVSICLAATFALISATGNAQDSLTLDRCLALAMKNNPRLRLSENALRSAELSISELGTSRLPQVSGVATAIYAPMPPTFGYDPAISNGGEVAGQIVIHQPLYDAGIRDLKSAQLQIDVERSVQERGLAQLELTFAVKQAFVEALRAQQAVDLQQQSVAQLTAYDELVNRLYNGGTANYTDVLKTEIQTSAAQLGLDKSRESFSSARLSLFELLGIPVDTTARIEGSFVESAEQSVDTVGGLQENDLADNIEMRIAGLQVERSQLDIELAHHERLPDLSLFADAGYVTSGENLRLPGGSRLNTLGYSIGVDMAIPILNWGATGLRIQEKELAADDSRLQQELLRRSLSTEIRQASLQLVSARTRLRTLRENIRKAEENFLLTKSKYAAGAALSLEVLAAQQLQTDTKMDELQARADIQTLLARLERLTATSHYHPRQ